MQFSDFKKTDGQSSESGGITHYRIDFEGSLKALQNCTYKTTGQLSATGASTDVAASAGERFARAGDIVKVKGHVLFERSEAGWTVKSVDMAPTEPLVMPAVVQNNPTRKTDSNNIFGIPTPGSGGPSVSPTPTPVSPAAPAIAVHPDVTPKVTSPAVPSVSLPPTLSISDARAKLDAATANVERKLASDPAYRQAKSDVAAADARKKAALAANGAGSPEVLETAQQLLDAKARLAKIMAAAVAKDPTAQAAQRDLAEAEKAARRK